MRYLFIILGVALGLGGLRLWRDWREAQRFGAWRVDHQRRIWAEGDVNQSCIRQWPIQKAKNEMGWRNTKALGKRA